jgi:kynurenine formamidase
MFTLFDLTRQLSSDTLAYPGDSYSLRLERVKLGIPDMTVSRLSHFDLHAATHIDAPLHFVPGGRDIADVTPKLYPLCLVRTTANPITAPLVPAEVNGMAVVFHTGWEARGDSASYFDGFPHLTPEAAHTLVDRGAALIGIDSPSIDPNDETHAFPAHRIVLGAGIPVVEGLCNLGRLASGHRYLFGAFALPIRGAEASPVRAIALSVD